MYEDDPGWDCATMGNRICGTLNADMPDTSMQEVPSGLPLDGIGLIVVLLATLIFRRNRTR